MFEDAHGVAVIAASDLARARSFYEDVLGLEPQEVQEEAQAVTYRLGDGRLMVYETSYAGTAQNTVFGIESGDLDSDMAALREKGVEFIEYDFPGLKTVNGVADMAGERASWFADSEGNILALMQRA